MARKKENMNLATEIICDIKRRLIICRIALAVSLAGNVIMAAMLICKQSRHGAAGVKACCLFLLPAILLPAQHIICRNVRKCQHYSFIGRQQQSCRIVANSGIFTLCWEFLYTIRAREKMRESAHKKEKSYKKLHKKRNRTESDAKKELLEVAKSGTKKSFFTRYARAGEIRETSRKCEQKKNYVTR